MAGWVLGIDFGTTTTAAATANGTVEVVVVGGAPRMASTVVVDGDGVLRAGAAAEREATVAPERAERTPKRRLGDRLILLGEHAITPVDAVAAVLAEILDEVTRQHDGEAPSAVRMTHPVTWADARLDLLRAAAAKAGLPDVELLPEPVAAAMHLAGAGVEEGQHVAVYDLGGGTFDTVVLRRTGDGFTVVGAPGGDDRIGGEYFDERLYQYVGQRIAAANPDAWTRLRGSDERSWARADAALRGEIRSAKEALSTVAEATIYVPSPVDLEVRVTRTELEELLTPDIERTVDELDRTVTGAGLALDDLAAVYLVGGSSRIPLVARLVGARFGRAPSTWGDPKAVVALGAAGTARRDRASALAASAPAVPTAAPATPPAAVAAASSGGPSRRWLVLGLLAVVVLVAAGLTAILGGGGDDDPIVTAGEVFLEPASDEGPDAFTESVSLRDEPLPSSRAQGDSDGATTAPTADDATAIRAVTGTQPGLYGGTRDQGSCDPGQLVSFLGDNADLGRAWATVLRIEPTAIADYVAGLTPLVLRDDTRVTNHGYRNGRATPRQAVLQAGTAVLVDSTGVPRVKCACGNPLAEPVPVTGATRYTGDAWEGFEPAALAVYRAGPPVTEFVVTDIDSGDTFVRPVATTGEADGEAGDVTSPTVTEPTPDTGDGSTTGPAFFTTVDWGETVEDDGVEGTISNPRYLDYVCGLTPPSGSETPGCPEDTSRIDGPFLNVEVRICNNRSTDLDSVAMTYAVTMFPREQLESAEGPNYGRWGGYVNWIDPNGISPPGWKEGEKLAPGACFEGAYLFPDSIGGGDSFGQVGFVFDPIEQNNSEAFVSYPPAVARTGIGTS